MSTSKSILNQSRYHVILINQLLSALPFTRVFSIHKITIPPFQMSIVSQDVVFSSCWHQQTFPTTRIFLGYMKPKLINISFCKESYSMTNYHVKLV